MGQNFKMKQVIYFLNPFYQKWRSFILKEKKREFEPHCSIDRQKEFDNLLSFLSELKLKFLNYSGQNPNQLLVQTLSDIRNILQLETVKIHSSAENGLLAHLNDPIFINDKKKFLEENPHYHLILNDHFLSPLAKSIAIIPLLNPGTNKEVIIFVSTSDNLLNSQNQIFLKISIQEIELFLKSIETHKKNILFQRFFQKLMKNSSHFKNAFAIINTDYQVIESNDLFEEIFRSSSSHHFQTKNSANNTTDTNSSSNKTLLFDHYSYFNCKRWHELVDRVLHGHQESSHEEFIQSASKDKFKNETILAKWHLSSWRDHLGKVGGIFLSFDVREKEIESTNSSPQLAQNPSKEKPQKISNFILGMIGHEARTPLNSIIGFSSLIKDEITILNDSKKLIGFNMPQYINKITSSTIFLQELINNYLDYTKLQDGQIVLEPYPFNFENIIQEFILPVVEEKLQGRPTIKFDLNISRYLKKTIFHGDALRIKQIILNFLNNAFKYTQSGEISLHIMPSPSLLEFGVLIKISDTGQGISEKDREHIFKPYFTRPATSMVGQSGQGTGLGLFITKHFIELMGGTIKVEGEVGKGTVFTMTIPLALYKENQQREQKNLSKAVMASSPHPITPLTPLEIPLINRPISSAEITRPKIENKDIMSGVKYPLLVAEDDDDGRLLIGLYLKKMGYEYEIVKDGKEVIQKVVHEKKSYQLILMDIQMPEMDGLTATRLIREAGNNLPIFALTAHALEEHREQAIKVGMNGHIKKPINREELKNIIQKIYQN